MPGPCDDRLPVYILAGGRSSRFGSDKALIEVGGRPLIRRIADALAPRAGRITVVADRPGKYAPLGLETIADAVAGLGPMGGLLAAIEHCGPDDPWLLLTCCDLVGVDAAWVEPLWTARTAQAQVVAFKSEGWEPLFALYHRSILDEVRRRAQGADRSMRGLIQSCIAVPVPLPPGVRELAQINTRGDLARYARA